MQQMRAYVYMGCSGGKHFALQLISLLTMRSIELPIGQRQER